jgi:hypothetical protein
MSDNKLQNQNSHSTPSKPVVELTENELDTIAGGNIPDIINSGLSGAGNVAGSIIKANSDVSNAVASTASDVLDALW